MNIIKSLEKRRSYYDINKELPVDERLVFELVEKATELVPDAFNMKSSKLVVVAGDKQDELWDNIYEAFGGKVSRDKMDSFKRGYGTILYFYDTEIVNSLKDQFPTYADNFEDWASQSSGMLQLCIWSGLRELEIGASIQHYNPVIDDMVKEMFSVPKSYKLKAQMPFGGIGSEREEKESEDISKRVTIVK